MKVRFPTLVRGLGGRRRQRLPDLGERELLVLEVLWGSGEATAQTVQSAMPDKHISLSTVQSTLERLYRKNLVERAKEGRAYLYSATMSKSQLITRLLGDMADHVAAGDLAPMISGFINYVSTEAPELLGDLSKSLDIERSGDSSTAHDDD